jgi:hypothetical protein
MMVERYEQVVKGCPDVEKQLEAWRQKLMGKHSCSQHHENKTS